MALGVAAAVGALAGVAIVLMVAGVVVLLRRRHAKKRLEALVAEQGASPATQGRQYEEL